MRLRGVIGNTKKGNNSKKAQMKISFGLIFTIILIIFFLSFAVLSIRKTIVHKDEIIAGKFIHDLRIDMQETGSHEQALIEVDYKVPEGVTQIYFEPPEKDDEGNIIETDNPNVHFNHEDYLGGTINGINWEYSNDKEKSDEEEEENPVVPDDGEEEKKKPLIFNVSEDGRVRFYLIKEYGVEYVIIDLDGIFEIPIIEFNAETFHVGESQNHGTYEDIMAKGASGEYKILFNLDFENRELGLYPNEATFKEDWRTSWSNRGEFAEIVPDPSNPNNKALLITFPFIGPGNYSWICWDDGCGDEDNKRISFDDEPTNKRYRTLIDGDGPSSGGLTVEIPLRARHNDVYLSYNIKYEPDWAAPAGGKLPGFLGGQDICSNCIYTDCLDSSGECCDNPPCDDIADYFLARHIFFSNQQISYYIYDADKEEIGFSYGEVRGIPNTMIYDGNWHNIVFRIRLNDGGVKNGVAETWIDGEKYTSMSGILFKTAGSDFGIDTITFSNFFGGSGMPCSDIESKFEESCRNREWWDPGNNWIKACAVDIDNPCAGVLKYEDGSYYGYWTPRKTEYIHFDDIVAYVP
jgi:hypothetical protein